MKKGLVSHETHFLRVSSATERLWEPIGEQKHEICLNPAPYREGGGETIRLEISQKSQRESQRLSHVSSRLYGGPET